MATLDIINIKDTTRANLLWLLALCFVFTIPISQWACVRLLVFALLLSFFVPSDASSIRSILTNSWDIGLYLLILVLGLAYTEDMSLGLRVIETNFSFFAVPIVFSKIKDFNKVKLHQVLYIFTFGLAVASLICLGNAFFRFDGDVHGFFFNQLVGVLDFQPTYFAYYLIAALSFGLYTLYFGVSFFAPRWNMIVLGFLFLVLMLTGGLTTFMSILLTLSFFALKFVLDKQKKVKLLTFALVATMLTSMFAFSFIYKTMDSDLSKVTDHWERSVLWESAISASPDFIFGVGTGDYKKVINQFYVDHNMVSYADLSYNAHNQFIQSFFANGILGLITLALLLGRPFFMSVKRQYLLGALLFFPFFIYGMTEVFLGRFQGVVFFAVLHQSLVVFYERSSLYRKEH